MFLFQTAPYTLKAKKDKVIYYFLNWKSKGVYTFQLISLYTTFFSSEQNSYTSKNVSIYIANDLDTCQKKQVDEVLIMTLLEMSLIIRNIWC